MDALPEIMAIRFESSTFDFRRPQLGVLVWCHRLVMRQLSSSALHNSCCLVLPSITHVYWISWSYRFGLLIRNRVGLVHLCGSFSWYALAGNICIFTKFLLLLWALSEHRIDQLTGIRENFKVVGWLLIILCGCTWLSLFIVYMPIINDKDHLPTFSRFLL